MGLGKTFVGAEKAISLNKDILIVCQKSKIADWKEHFFKYYIDKMKCDESGVWCYDLTLNSGMDMFLHSRYRIKIGVINYELAWRRQTELLKLHDFTLILDESSLIQNQSAKQSKFILKLNPDNVILLSGTPTAGKYENLWSQLHLLGWKISEDVYNKEYKKFMKDCIITVDDNELIGDTTLTKRLYARQLCGQYNKHKLEAFKELVESTNDRLIVFYNFNAELDALKNIVNDRPISEVNGHCKDLTAYEQEDNSITFIQYQAGAMGLNLQKANKIIYFTLTDKCEDWMQSQKRIHRLKQDKPCFYYILMCKDSVEEQVYKSLERGVDFTDELFKEYERNEK